MMPNPPFERRFAWLRQIFGAGRGASLGCAIFLVLVTFPDAIFLGRSLLPSAIWNEFSLSTEKPSALPYWEPKYRRLADGYADNFSGALQFEPIQLFMRDCLRDGESPYWNPYSASGALGPESLVDSKFSLFTLATALCGASSFSFHLVLFSIQILSLFCLHHLLTRHFQLKLLPAAVGCAVYYLGGYHQAYLNNHIAQPYILAPLLLWPLFSFLAAPSRAAFGWMVLAEAAIQSTGFVPGIVVMHLFAGSLAVAFLWEQKLPVPAALRRLLPCGLAIGLAALLLAPLWLPFFASLDDTTLLSDYLGRSIRGPSIKALLSQFSPEHFWESYASFQLLEGKKMLGGAKQPGFINHWGILATLAAAVAIGSAELRRRPLFWTMLAAVLISHGMEWQWPGFNHLAGLPVLRSIRPQYWGAGSLAGIAFLSAWGIQYLHRKTALSWPVLAVAAVIGYAYHLAAGAAVAFPTPYGWRSSLALVILGAGLLCLAAARFLGRWQSAMAVVLSLGITLELLNYVNHLHPQAVELEENMPRWVEVLRENVGDGRTLNLGQRTLLPEWGSALRIDQVESMGASKLRYYQDFWNKRLGPPRTLFLRFQSISPKVFDADKKAMDLLGIRLVVARTTQADIIKWMTGHGMESIYRDKERIIFRNPAALPRSFVVPRLLPAGKTPWDLGFDARTLATTEDADLLQQSVAAGAVQTAPNPAGSVILAEEHHTRVTLQANLATPGILILTETWSPGWSVLVDGVQRHLGRVNMAFRGVVLPAGNHRVTFIYQPPFLRTSIAVALLAALGLLIVLGWKRRVHEAAEASTIS